MIPKIIHSTGPSDKSTWNPIWNDCIGSWKNQFSELDYFHFNWNYEELDDLIRDDYPEFWDLYQLFSFYDMKIDFAQYCLLHKYGGIYHNLNVYCYQEFYESIKNLEFVLLESYIENEYISSCITASKPGDPFWIDLIYEIKRTYYNYPHTADTEQVKLLSEDFYHKDVTGNYMLSRFALRYNRPVAIMSKEEYNPSCNFNSELCKTKQIY